MEEKYLKRGGETPLRHPEVLIHAKIVIRGILRRAKPPLKLKGGMVKRGANTPLRRSEMPYHRDYHTFGGNLDRGG